MDTLTLMLQQTTNGGDFPTWAVFVSVLAGAVVIAGAGVGIGRWVGGIGTKVSSFDAFVTEIREDVKAILLRLPPVPVAGSSPLELTDFGEKLSQWLNAPQWAEKEVDGLGFPVEAEEDFVLDALAERHVENELDQDTKDLVAKCAYEFGTGQDGVRNVLRVVLRDELIKRSRSASSSD